jgi:hypothetical protein
MSTRYDQRAAHKLRWGKVEAKYYSERNLRVVQEARAQTAREVHSPILPTNPRPINAKPLLVVDANPHTKDDYREHRSWLADRLARKWRGHRFNREDARMVGSVLA